MTLFLVVSLLCFCIVASFSSPLSPEHVMLTSCAHEVDFSGLHTETGPGEAPCPGCQLSWLPLSLFLALV